MATLQEALDKIDFKIKEGIKVGELAKKIYLDGINVPIEDVTENIRKTKELMMKRKPLFEAGFKFENYYARVDILLPINNIRLRNLSSIIQPMYLLPHFLKLQHGRTIRCKCARVYA